MAPTFMRSIAGEREISEVPVADCGIAFPLMINNKEEAACENHETERSP
jgi:hypothetical protein